MQFVANGPDIPESLLLAHEQGRVVFFCGAGVSYPAGLPGFRGLVDAIYDTIGEQKSEIEQSVLSRDQFDAGLDLLERRVQGQRLTVRRALREVLKPNLRLKGATSTHQALLKLARQRDGAIRLVTTNYDRLFELAAQKLRVKLGTFGAPLLPVPKQSRWDGLVYLHGVLPEMESDSSLHRLILTSGDFGLAYLTERWASRFVGELFRQYVVCFVGYTINDPVLRYMMDALAADRMQGESTPQAYAFGECEVGQERAKNVEWEAKGVVPILYARDDTHSALHSTLHRWGETWESGVLGKESLVVESALAKPSASTVQDNFVGRMLWALMDESALPAKRFAEHVPVPSLEWLGVLDDMGLRHADLPRVGVPQATSIDSRLEFSLLNRPSPYKQAPWMCLVGAGPQAVRLDSVMFQFGRWLTRHLNDPELLIWVAEKGGEVNPDWKHWIYQELNQLETLKAAGKHEQVSQMNLDSPNAVPTGAMRTLWGLVLSGRARTKGAEHSLFEWMRNFKRDGLSYGMRLELRRLLAPRVRLERPYRWGDAENAPGSERSISSLVKWEIVLSGDHADSILLKDKAASWKAVLPTLLPDLEGLLQDALDLRRELGGADDLTDDSNFDMPSIEQHAQNRRYREWVVLLELLRDSWLSVKAADVERARLIASRWFERPYPTFKRLALYAANQGVGFSDKTWLGWLTERQCWWLWSEQTKRECLQLLQARAPALGARERRALEQAILAGPPRELFVIDIEADALAHHMERMRWLRMSMLEAKGFVFGADGKRWLAKVRKERPELERPLHESDEFSVWMGEPRDMRTSSDFNVEPVPRAPDELAGWLRRTPYKDWPFRRDGWAQACKERPKTCLRALGILASEADWPVERWRLALQASWESDKAVALWPTVVKALLAMPDDILVDLAGTVGWGMYSMSKTLKQSDKMLLALCNRITELPLRAESGVTSEGKPLDEPVTESLNHPIGNTAQALLETWFKGKPEDGFGIPGELKALFSRLCDTSVPRFRHARVMFCSQVIALFRADGEWARASLLPLFDWKRDATEARVAWDGFLWSPRLYRPLLAELKGPFLATAGHYEVFRQHAQQYASFLTYVAVEGVEGYAASDFRDAISKLPLEGLEQCSRALYQTLEAAGERRGEYWRLRVKPFWKACWPKGREMVTPTISEACVRLCIASDDEFSDAVEFLKIWLLPFEHLDYILGLLRESGLPSSQPRAALQLLDAIVGQPAWLSMGNLRECLDAIKSAEPALAKDRRFKRLEAVLRR